MDQKLFDGILYDFYLVFLMKMLLTSLFSLVHIQKSLTFVFINLSNNNKNVVSALRFHEFIFILRNISLKIKQKKMKLSGM